MYGLDNSSKYTGEISASRVLKTDGSKERFIMVKKPSIKDLKKNERESADLNLRTS